MPSLFTLKSAKKDLHLFFIAEDKEHAAGLAIAIGAIDSYHDVDYVADCTDLFIDPVRTCPMAIRKILGFFEGHQYGLFKWKSVATSSYYITVELEPVRDVETV